MVDPKMLRGQLPRVAWWANGLEVQQEMRLGRGSISNRTCPVYRSASSISQGASSISQVDCKIAGLAALVVLTWACWFSPTLTAQQPPLQIQFGNSSTEVRQEPASITASQQPATEPAQPGPGLIIPALPNTALPNTAGQNPAPTTPPAAPPTAPTATPPTLTPLEQTASAITARLQQVQEDTEKKPELKEPLVKQYQTALSDLKAIAETQKQRAQFQARIAAAPAVLEDAKARRSKSAARATLSDSLDFMSFDEVQKELQALQAELATTTELRTKLSEQIVTREKRRKELPQLMSDGRAKLDALGTGASTAAAIEDPLLKEAVGWSALTARTLAAEQLQTLETEQRAYEAEAEAIPMQLELTQAAEKQQQEQVRKVTEELNRMRQDRILQQRDEVRALLVELPDELEQASEALLKRISDWLELAAKRATVKTELDTAKSVFELWKERFVKMKNRVDPQDGQDVVAGFNSWIGEMLRKQRGELPDPAKLSGQIRQYQQELQNSETMLFGLEDALIDANTSLESLSAQAAEADERPRAEYLLLEKAKVVITSMQVDVDGYMNDVLQVADIKEQTRLLSQRYAEFIDEHVLWIRSSDRLQQSEVGPLVEAFRWLVSYKNWTELTKGLMADLFAQPWWYAMFAITWLVLLFNQTRLRRGLGLLSDQAAKRNCVIFRYTAEAALITLCITIPLPLLFLFLHWRLHSLDKLDFAKSFGNGLLLATAVFFPLELMRQTSRVGGLGIRHFEWTEKGARILRGNLRWLIDFSLPIVIVVAIFSSQKNIRWESSLGRVAFITLMVLLAIFFGRIFMPRTGVLARYVNAYPDSWFGRLRFGWYSTIVIIPVSLAALSFVGYHYTAQRLASHLNTTLWLIVCLTMLFFLLRRWLLLGRRKLMIAQAKQRLAEVARRDPNLPASPLPDEPEINLVVINEQTMRLVSSFIVVSALVAIFMIWSDVMPAIALLENFKLWTVQGDLPDETINITLANLVFLIPIVALMMIAVRNVPGLLEIALLQHLPITSAVRYAITTLSRYLIFVIGIIFVSNTIGLRWSSIQWLVAALGVGLGFGLQEIFANFVSGLILLFEQPIRVGDIITLDGVTGSVARIRMRATTIVNWDRQELIIPNKDLITGKLLNWTLSDTTNRVVIQVGVAYGTDTEAACNLIKQICRSHPNILQEPAPLVSFDKFDDSSLRLTIRVFLASLEVRLPTIHELHTRIHQEFNAAGIEIAFPQRDLNIRTLPPQFAGWSSKP